MTFSSVVSSECLTFHLFCIDVHTCLICVCQKYRLHIFHWISWESYAYLIWRLATYISLHFVKWWHFQPKKQKYSLPCPQNIEKIIPFFFFCNEGYKSDETGELENLSGKVWCHTEKRKNASRKLIKWLAALCEIAAEQFLYIFW